MGQRPPHLKPPVYLSRSPPVPQPEAPEPQDEHGGPKNEEPVRYADWTLKGKAIDF